MYDITRFAAMSTRTPARHTETHHVYAQPCLFLETISVVGGRACLGKPALGHGTRRQQVGQGRRARGGVGGGKPVGS